MNKELLSFFGDSDQLFELLNRIYPSAKLTPASLEALLEDARRSDNPALKGLGKAGDLTEDARLALNAQAQSGEHTLYALTATHTRSAPFQSAFTQPCQAVRVTLPAQRSGAEGIWTHLGIVKPDDHLIFSAAEVQGRYEQMFGTSPAVGRVDLITGARYLDLVRFSPVSIFLAYTHETDEVPAFYFLESGSATGTPEALYYLEDMQATSHAPADFAFTPFACPANWYTGRLTMTDDGKEPQEITISVAQNRDGQRHYLDLGVSYAIAAAGDVIFPGAQFVMAVMRVLAIGLGMQLDDSVMMREIGKLCREALPWDIEPPLTGQPDGYLGCPGSSS